MLDCTWKQEYGIDCLTCGFQRSLQLLFQGELIESILLFPATIPFLATVLIAALYIWKRFKNGNNWIIGMFSFTALLVVVNYSIKISNGTFIH